MPFNTTSTESTARSSQHHHPPNILRDALIGGTVGILLAFLPLSTMLGGGIAGFLQGKWQNGAWARAGGLAGGIAFLPHLIVGPYIVLVLDVVPLWIPPGYLLIGLLGFGLLYTVGIGVVGGLLGAYLRREHSDA